MSCFVVFMEKPKKLRYARFKASTLRYPTDSAIFSILFLPYITIARAMFMRERSKISEKVLW